MRKYFNLKINLGSLQYIVICQQYYILIQLSVTHMFNCVGHFGHISKQRGTVYSYAFF